MRDAASRRFELIVFDWDGTLADSTTLIAEALQHACRDLGLAGSRRRGRALRDRAGTGRCAEARRAGTAAGSAIRNSARTIGSTIWRAKPRSRCSTARASCWPNSTRPAICWPSRPARPARGLDRALAKNGTGHGVFHATRCADEGFPKPHPDMLLHLMDRLAVESARDADDRRHDARSRPCAECRRGGPGGRLRRASRRRTSTPARAAGATVQFGCRELRVWLASATLERE